MSDTATLHFEGYSDDTFGEYSATNEDYCNNGDGSAIEYAITADGWHLLVRGELCPGRASSWAISVASVDLDGGASYPIPRWPMRFERSERGHTPRLVIEVPADYTLRCLNEADGE